MTALEPWSGAQPAMADEPDRGYAGLATRALAFAIDGAIVNAVAWSVALVVALGLSLFEIPDDLRTVLAAAGAVVALVWTLSYFTFFWSTTGQTPGNRVMRIEVRTAGTGETLGARRALARVLLLPLSVIPLCAGALLILVERRRRALHDCLIGTVVTYRPAPSSFAPAPARALPTTRRPAT